MRCIRGMHVLLPHRSRFMTPPAGSIDVHCMYPCTAAVPQSARSCHSLRIGGSGPGPPEARSSSSSESSTSTHPRQRALGTGSLLPGLRAAPAVSSSSASSFASTCPRPHCAQHRVTTPVRPEARRRSGSLVPSWPCSMLRRLVDVGQASMLTIPT